MGDLDKVKLVKLVGFVNCVDGFEQQPAVINGCSDLLGRCARQRVYPASLSSPVCGVNAPQASPSRLAQPDLNACGRRI